MLRLLTIAIVCAAAIPASAQAPLLTGLGGTRDYGTDCLSPNDDGSSNLIPLASAFPSGLRFFDRTHTSAFVNTNGNITFSRALSTYTPRAFPIADQPMIAPYWADVDIRGVACSGYSGSMGCANPTENGVWWHLAPGMMVVTWDNVGYFYCADDLKMSFQLILTAAPTCGGEGDFDVEFRFNRCEWTTGDASGGTGGFGGTPAQSGFDAGNTTDFVEIMGSRTGMIHTQLCTMSNVEETGVWRFQIRSGAVLCPDAGDTCDTGRPGACGVGATQCVGMGTECRTVVEPSDELCDAIDNDCDGDTDEGELCGELGECRNGVCVDLCFEGGCPEGQECTTDGQCLDIGCGGVECESGQRCVAGSCVDACAGVVCPGTQDCVAGRCIDLCNRIDCDECTACDGGACVPMCTEESCAADQTCTESGHCVETACVGVTCGDAEECVLGLCQDTCLRAECPRGQACIDGECIIPPTEPPDTVPDAGSAGSADAGSSPEGDAGCPPGFTCGSDRPPGRGGSSGCGCATVGLHVDGAPAVNALLFGGLLALFLWRRRRG